MDPLEAQRAAALMRVNHTGELCAQALYLGQALLARDPALRQHLYQAADEERAHLQWCTQRIQALKGRRSIFSPLFALGSFGIGCAVGLLGDKHSLGFLAETERQVSEHLEEHLALLSRTDHESHAVLTQMKNDEEEHATQAIARGGQQPPPVIQGLMRCMAKVMTTLTRLV